jgi:hypothetical protein
VEENQSEILIVDRLLDTVRHGNGVTVDQVAEALECTQRQVRNGVTALRRKYQHDHADHIVSWKGRFWLASELEAAGHQLQPTAKGGTLKVVSKPKPAAPKKTKEEVEEALRAELGDHPDADKIARLVCLRYDEMVDAQAKYRETLVKVRNGINGAEAAFKETIEGARASGDVDAAVNKLYGVEMAWQTKEEKKAEAIEERKEALRIKKAAEDKLAGLIENCRQLDLGF